MPAADLARLKEQVHALAQRWRQPQVFRQAFNTLLESYSNLSYRPGAAIQPLPVLPSHHVPALLGSQLEIELSHLVPLDADAGLALVDQLWQEDYQEPRLLAAGVLGMVTPTPPEPVIERLRAWSRTAPGLQLQNALLQRGATRLRREQTAFFLQVVENWLSDSTAGMQGIGLKALLPLVQDRDFENLPILFRLLTPFVLTAPPAHQPEILSLLEELARRSPAETAHFMRQMLSLAGTPATARLVRRCLPLFPPAHQESLRRSL